MRTRLIVSLSAVLATGSVSAQDEDAEAPAPEEAAEETAPDEVQPERDVVRPPQQGDRIQTGPRGAQGAQGEPSAPGQVHTVVTGDTLWDLSQSYLGSPWYWPKVWSYNPQVANPHWIYPGDRIRFFATGEEVPARVEVGDQAGGTVIASGGASDESFGDDEGQGTVEATGRIGYEPPGTMHVPVQGFVTQRELDEAGKIAGSFSEAKMLSFPDTVYIRFENRDQVQLGGKYVVFRTVDRVRHPITKDWLGYMTHFLGTVRVVAVDREFVTAQIESSRDDILRGDLIGPMQEELSVRVSPRPNERDLDATLVEMMIPFLTIAGEHQTVVVDRGSADGVQPGNTFHVVRQQDMGGVMMRPEQGQEDQWPPEVVGSCIILDVKDQTSTCLVVRSIREVVRGDRMVMRVGGDRTAQR